MSTDNYLFDKFVLRIILFVYSIENAILKRCVLLITKALKILKKKKIRNEEISNVDCLQSMIENSKKKRKKKKRYFSSVKRIVYSTSLLFDIDCRCVLFFSSISTLKPPPASTIRHSLPHPPPPSLLLIFSLLSKRVRITSARVWRSF